MSLDWLRERVRRSRLLSAVAWRVQWRVHVLLDWWGTKVWTRTVEVATPLGFKFNAGLHPAYRQMRQGQFEVVETALLSHLFARVDRFIDVGANLGYYTCLALQRGRPVVAFEPQQQNLECLYRNLQVNGWQAEVFPLALGERPGLLTLYGASGPSASLVKDWAGYSARYQQVVPVSTLDNIVSSRFGGERLLVKIDVEGAEYQVLKGALQTIARTPKPIWMLEVCLAEFHPGGVNPDFREIFQLFWRCGYAAYAATDTPRLITPDDIERWWQARRSDTGTFNYVFLDPAMELPTGNHRHDSPQVAAA